MVLGYAFSGLTLAEYVQHGQLRTIEFLIRSDTARAGQAADSARADSKAYALAVTDSIAAMADATSDAAEGVTDALYRCTSRLGGQLSEIAWALEQLSTSSREIADLLRESLDNESRQLYEQGIKSYRVGELDMAEVCFRRSLDVNTTNYSAYQYCGFIAARKADSQAADRFFELALKFAPNAYQRALALAHRAQCQLSLGNATIAATFAERAVQLVPGSARFCLEAARYQALAGKVVDALTSLERAARTDPQIIPAARCEPAFDGIRDAASQVLDSVREDERATTARVVQAVVDACALVAPLLPSETSFADRLVARLNAATVVDFRGLRAEVRPWFVSLRERAEQAASRERETAARILQDWNAQMTTKADVERSQGEASLKRIWIGVSLGLAYAWLIVGTIFDLSQGRTRRVIDYALQFTILAAIFTVIIGIPVGAILYVIGRPAIDRRVRALIGSDLHEHRIKRGVDAEVESRAQSILDGLTELGEVVAAERSTTLRDRS